MTARTLALFDLDETLIAGDSDYEWGLHLVSLGVVDRVTYEARNQEFYDRYRAGTLVLQDFLAFQLYPLSPFSRAQLDGWHAEFLASRILPMIRPGARALLDRHRDAERLIVTATNIEAAISETEQVLEYYMMDDPALNGFASEVNLEIYLKSGRKLLETRPIRTQTMRALLESHLQGVQEIDFLSVDVEGLDLQVLRSNDWKRSRPRFILTGAFPPSAAEALRQFLGEQGYRCIANTVSTLLFSST